MSDADQGPERHINIHFSPEIMGGTYANFANVSFSDYEFTITFARVDHEVAALHVFARAAHVLAELGHHLDRDALAVPLGVLLAHDAVGAGRQRRAGQDARSAAGRERRQLECARRHFERDRQPDR